MVRRLIRFRAHPGIPVACHSDGRSPQNSRHRLAGRRPPPRTGGNRAVPGRVGVAGSKPSARHCSTESGRQARREAGADERTETEVLERGSFPVCFIITSRTLSYV